jgi:hypothetical protein
LAALHARFVKVAAAESEPELAALDARLKPYVREPVRVDSKFRAIFVADGALVAAAHGVDIPPVFYEPDVMKIFGKAGVREWFGGYDDADFKRLAAGRMTSDLLLKLDSKVANAKDHLRLALNSCHDTTIGAWLCVQARRSWHN